MNTSAEHTIETWWQQLRPRLTALYATIALALLIISASGHLRLLSEVGHIFGGFFWAIDTDGQVVVVSTSPQLPPFGASASSLTSVDRIIGVNGQPVSTLTSIYQHARPGDTITYTIQHNNEIIQFKNPAALFTWDMWWQNYGLLF